VTILGQTAGTDVRSHLAFRLVAFVFAGLLALQCVWLLAAELVRPGIDRLPTDIAAAEAAAEKHGAASLAASIGAIRGDLWADSAFTDADLLWSKKGARGNEDPPGTLPHARTSLDRALDDSPHLSSAWLLLAGLASRFPSLGLDATELLKVSYYTGPSEQNLIPLRLRIAVQSDNFSDVEIRQFVSRDIHFLLSQKQTSAISEAYNTASSVAKGFMEQTIRDIDPSALAILRTGVQKQNLPD
jgi:hypothetical protein